MKETPISQHLLGLAGDIQVMAKILIVDDDEHLLDALKRCLSKARPKWQLEVAANGTDAMAKLTEDNFDVLLTDIEMQEMTGATLLLECSIASPSTMRVAMSGRFDNLSTYAMTHCSHMYLAKPFEISALVEMIEPELMKHGQKLRRAAIILEDTVGREGNTDLASTTRRVRRRIYRERLRRIGISLGA